MSIEDIDGELQRRFDIASANIDLEPGSVGPVRERAAQRSRTNRVLKGVAAAAAIGGIVVGGFGLRSIAETPKTELDVAAGPTNDDASVDSGRVTEADLTYLGAFLAPAEDGDGNGGEQGTTFAYGGQAAAFNPSGDPANTDDFSGSLFLTSHPRRNPGVAEISIPAPAPHDGSTQGLPIATRISPFADITAGRGATYVGSTDVGGLDEFRYGGLEVVDGPDGPRLHWSIYQYGNVSDGDLPGHGHSSLDMANPNPQGPWSLGDLDNRLSAGYLFEVPAAFATRALDGQTLITGFRGGPATQGRSWGPPFYAYAPPSAQDPGSRLDATVIAENPDRERALDGFGQADTAAGAVWLTNSAGEEAVVTVGYRGLGEVIQGAPRAADCGINTSVHAGPYEPLMMFYDPDDLARAAAGDIESWELEPYRTWNPAEHLIPTCQWELTSISVDSSAGLVYVVQREADTSQNEFSPVPVIHVFRI